MKGFFLDGRYGIGVGGEFVRSTVPSYYRSRLLIFLKLYLQFKFSTVFVNIVTNPTKSRFFQNFSKLRKLCSCKYFYKRNRHRLEIGFLFFMFTFFFALLTLAECMLLRGIHVH